jgi:flagellar biosynthesis protein FliR
MVSIYQFSEPEMIAFVLVLLRISAFMVSWPVFGVESVPMQVKILFALVLAFIVFPVTEWRQVQVDFDSSSLIWLALREAFIGVCFGFLGRMFFMAVRVTGEMISLSIGLSGAQLFNPSMGGQTTPVDQFFYSLAGLLFLTINGHHLFIAGLIDTFRILPIGNISLNMAPFATMGEFVQEVIAVGLRMSGPIVIAILIVNLVMGLLGKTVPQINVLVTSLAVNVIVGLVVFFISLPIIMGEMPDLLEMSASRLFQMVKAF